MPASSTTVAYVLLPQTLVQWPNDDEQLPLLTQLKPSCILKGSTQRQYTQRIDTKATTRWGKSHEDDARLAYLQLLQLSHKDATVTTSGLVIDTQ